ncbi:MAG: heavy-metal-associated domain-containing protein, partial [Mariprofundaceae bacterium]|nr:heavy-metal-associated domain-containing protein [Mariprofundaceae bacterium]
MERDFKVDNTQCEGCEATIVNQLMGMPGVLAAKADAETGMVWVQYDPAKVRFDALPSVVE